MDMADTRTGLDARAAAIAELFESLDALMVAYQALPVEDRSRHWSADADRITADVARHLSAARARPALTFPSRPRA